MDTKYTNSSIMLRELMYEDWKSVHKYASIEDVCKYQPWGPNTEEESVDFVNMSLNDAKQSPRMRFVFAIIENNADEMIGAVELNIRDHTIREGEISYIIHPDYWNKGFATEAGNMIVEYGFSELNLHRLYATCDPRNVSSEMVLRKLGMVKEGRLRQDILLRNGWRDSFIYGLLQHEWKERKRV